MTDFGPCADWPVTWMCDVSTTSPAATGQAVEVATYWLWAMSGRQFGTCTVTLRPCRRDCADGYGMADLGPPWTPGMYPVPALIGGLWFNIACGSCGDTCACTSLSEVVLPAPVSSVVSVKVDGSPLATGSYRVDDNRLLIRTDGGEWPTCNDLRRADTADNTWSVTAEYGQPVPEMGRHAAGELACEILRAKRGEDCRLAPSVQSLVRQGVTLQFPNFHEVLAEGLSGLYITDMFLRAVNPNGLPRRAKTYSVDRAAHRRVGT